MKENILVATDGSHTANKAVEFASEIAAKFGSNLTIGHVLHRRADIDELAHMAEAEHLIKHAAREAPAEYDTPPATMGALLADIQSGAETARLITLIGDELLARAERRARDMGVKNVAQRSVNGKPAKAILDLAEEVGADMVVLGHRGLGAVRTLVQGSVSQKVNQHATCTVVSVR
ncbi:MULTISPECIES: universal stress protein [Sediminimonas]|uniref:universal stress protein n=1 Tax=Sediminimonas TaxID=659427 RepID=UPI00041C9FB6|nr:MULTISPECIES: universal stress protein [Sediminimonas]MDR9484868.1 universal stress protein [Sediminimonas sp.]